MKCVSGTDVDSGEEEGTAGRAKGAVAARGATRTRRTAATL